MQNYQDWHEEFEEILREDFSHLTRPVRRNLSHLVLALILLLRTPRGWYGKISVSGTARTFPTGTTPKIRYKRLYRFLDNPHFTMDSLSPGLLTLVQPQRKDKLLPLIVDQTAIGDVEVITGSYPTAGRAIPMSMVSFEYGKIKHSRNCIEDNFLLKLASSCPAGVRPVWIMDRGYARVSLMQFCRLHQWLYIIRGRRDVIVEYEDKGRVYRKSLGRLRHRQGVARRYSNVLYQGQRREKVDIIVYRERGFKEPWFLIVPASSEKLLPTELVISWYRARMMIEVSFRDFKSQLGIKGLTLRVRRAERLNRLLCGLVLVYILFLSLGASSLGEGLRKAFEIPRLKPRHGTTRTLSVLSLALMAITDTFMLTSWDLMKVLIGLLERLRQPEVFASPLIA